MGIAMLSYFDIRAELAAGSLVVIELNDAQPEELSIWAIMATRRYLPMRVRAFLKLLEESLQ
jgi:DNA-binding transcriptional LysR family regulator